MSRHFISTSIAAFLFIAGVPAFADVLSVVGSVQVGATSVEFYPLPGPTGTFVIGPPNTGIFSGLDGSTGTILDLDNSMAPVDTPVNISNFMTFSAAPNLSFTLTEIPHGTFSSCPGSPAAAGQTCTPPGTAYNLTNQTAMSMVGSAEVIGYVVDSNNPGTTTPFVGEFSTQFTNMNYQQVLAAIAGGNSVSATYSAQFVTSPTPEPATLLTLGAGSLLLAGMAWMRRRNASLTKL